jgi:hypothetical protein
MITSERLYSVLLTLYPRSFRQEYGRAMTEAFLDLRGSHGRRRVAFWLFILADVCRSATYEQFRACGTGVRRFVMRWLVTCTLGIIGTGLVANTITWGFSYFYHPYLEGVTVAPWMFGAFLGLGLGIAQWATLRDRVEMGRGWLLVTVVSAAIGLQMVMTVTPIIGPLGSGLALGGMVGTGQGVVLRGHRQRTGWWILASGIAATTGMLIFGATMHRTLAGMNPLSNNVSLNTTYGNALTAMLHGLLGPKSWAELVFGVTFMATSGFVVGALTARPLSSISQH